MSRAASLRPTAARGFAGITFIRNKGKTAGTRMYDPPAVVICADSV
jgi:hypothetical protein